MKNHKSTYKELMARYENNKAYMKAYQQTPKWKAYLKAYRATKRLVAK